MQLRWVTEVSSSIYATPLITDLFSDAHKDIIVPSFANQVEVSVTDAVGSLLLALLQTATCSAQVLDAGDGAKAAEWGGYHQSTLHTSPLLFDLDYDGVHDIVVATYDGDFVAFKDTVSTQSPATFPSERGRYNMDLHSGRDAARQIPCSSSEGKEGMVCWVAPRSH